MSNITYAIPFWWPWIATIYVMACLVLGWRFIRAQNPYFNRRTRTILYGIRACTGAVVLALILDWRAVQSRTEEVKPIVQILVDHSLSMATEDTQQGLSRYDAAIETLNQTLIPAWTDPTRMRIGVAGQGYRDVHPADAAADAPRSAIGRALREVLENQSREPFGGVILLTDGAISDPDELHNTIQDYREARIPIFPWIMGTQNQADDIRILNASITQPSPSQPSLELELTIDSPGFAGQNTMLTISLDDQPLHQERIHLSGNLQTHLIDFVSPYRGLQFYKVEIRPVEGEATTENNVAWAAGEMRREPIRVIYMEGSEPRTISTLRDALESDPEMEVYAMHFPGDESVEALAAQARAVRGRDMRIFRDRYGREIPSVCHPTRGYPKTLEDLLKFDVVIFSDIIKEAFSEEQLDATVAFVEEFGGGFVMVGGITSFGAGEYEKTVIDKLMPIEVTNRSDPIWGFFSAAVTEAGSQHPIMQVGNTPEETYDAWNRFFPGFDGINYVRRAKPGALVLARTTRERTPRIDNLVLFAVQQIGRGRTMAFTSDTTPDWGSRFEIMWGPNRRGNIYYRQFWNNTIRWLAADRIARKGGQVRIETSASQAARGDTVYVRIPAESPTSHAGLNVHVSHPDNGTQNIPLLWNAGHRRWEGNFTTTQKGKTVITATYRNDEGATVSTHTGVHVRPDINETVAVAVQREPMEQAARETGGQMMDADNAADILNTIAARSVPVTWKRAIPVWDRWWFLIPLILLIASEWILRRYREPA